MADGTVFEERGLQSVALITDSFHNTARSMARVRGFPDYRYAAVENPIGSLGAEGIADRARQALPQVLAILGITDIRGLEEQ